MRVLLHRLVMDEGMRSVWGRLRKGSRPRPGEYLHQAIGMTQDEAYAILFRRALFGILRRPMVTRQEIIEREEKREQIPTALRKIARELYELEGCPRHIADVEGVAERIEQWAEIFTHDHDISGPLLVDRHRSDKHLRSYILKMVEVCTALFGTPLYGIVASISSVVFQQEVTDAQVQQMLRTRPPRGRTA